MEYTKLGRTGLKVSRLCLGTMNFGPETTEPDSHAIMDRALEHGINFFDTADVYGWKVGEGITEQIIGRWLAQGGGRRDKVVLATKVYGKIQRLAQRPGTLRPPHHRGLRQLAPPPADRLDRPLPDAPRRPVDAVGGDLAGDGDPGRAGQGALRRIVQLRRLAHRRRAGRGGETQLPRPRLRTVHLQPHDALRRTRGRAVRDRTRHRHHPVVAAARRPAVRCDSQGTRGFRRTVQDRAVRRRLERPPRNDRGLREAVRPRSGTTRRTSRSPGCCPDRA